MATLGLLYLACSLMKCVLKVLVNDDLTFMYSLVAFIQVYVRTNYYFDQTCVRIQNLLAKERNVAMLKCVCIQNLLAKERDITVDSRYNKLLGPSEITLLYQNFVISGLQNNKIQRNFELWDQENYFVISDFVISVFFITRVHCILYYTCIFVCNSDIASHMLINHYSCSQHV